MRILLCVAVFELNNAVLAGKNGPRRGKDSHSSLRKDTKVKSFPSQTRNEGEPINVALKKIAMGGLGQTAVQQCSGALIVAAPRNG